jgi:hypothetical protein
MKENREQDKKVAHQVVSWKGRKNNTKKRPNKGLNKKFITSIKVLKNRRERVSKTNKPINKQVVHLN